jgi:hypothetical protein
VNALDPRDALALLQEQAERAPREDGGEADGWEE